MFSEERILQTLQGLTPQVPKTLIILGSGWNEVLHQIEIRQEVTYETLFGVAPSVPGHMGKLVIGLVEGKEVGFMAGRFHMYEGYTAEEVTTPLRVFKQLGLESVVLTAAAGAINEKFKVGDFVILSDIMTLFLSTVNPLVGTQFTDMSEVFDQEWRQKAMRICADNDFPFHEGIYTWLKGPHFETPADKMALKILGTDVVGMSTVPEAIAARSLGLRVLGLAYVTNLAFVKHAHEDVIAAANAGSDRMVRLLRELAISA